MSPLPYTIEEAKRGSEVALAAEPMIFKTFLKTYRAAIRNMIQTNKGGDNDKRIDSAFYTNLHWQMERHLKRGRLLLACLPGYDMEWAGWALGGDDCLVYVWVKQIYRNQGVSLALVRGLLRARSIWYPYHGPGAEAYLEALEERLGLRFRFSPQAQVA